MTEREVVGPEWVAVRGRGQAVAVGRDGAAWALDCSPGRGGFGAYGWTGSAWAPEARRGIRLAVGCDGQPAMVDVFGRIGLRAPEGWSDLPGVGLDVAFDAAGTLWALTGPAARHSGRLAAWDRGEWVAHDAVGVRLTIASDGEPVVVDRVGVASRRSGSGWTPLPGLFMDVEASPAGELYAIGIDDCAYRTGGDTHRPLARDVAEVAATSTETWLLTRSGRFYRKPA